MTPRSDGGGETPMGNSIAKLALENARFERDAIAAGRLTLRMVISAVLAQPKLRQRMSMHDIKCLFEAIEAQMHTLPYHMSVLLENDKS